MYVYHRNDELTVFVSHCPVSFLMCLVDQWFSSCITSTLGENPQDNNEWLGVLKGRRVLEDPGATPPPTPTSDKAAMVLSIFYKRISQQKQKFVNNLTKRDYKSAYAKI